MWLLYALSMPGKESVKRSYCLTYPEVVYAVKGRIGFESVEHPKKLHSDVF